MSGEALHGERGRIASRRPGAPLLIREFAADLQASPDFLSLLQGEVPRGLLEESLQTLLPDILTGSCDTQSGERLIALGIHELLHFRAIVTMRCKLMRLLEKNRESAFLLETIWAPPGRSAS